MPEILQFIYFLGEKILEHAQLQFKKKGICFGDKMGFYICRFADYYLSVALSLSIVT